MARRALLLLALAAAAACRLDPDGSCATRADCAPGLDCLSGVCAACRGDEDCAAWQGCGADGLCALLPGRCDVYTDCASWETCDATAHTCALRADHCPNVTCTSPRVCDRAHDCSLPEGVCLVDADCNGWMGGCDTATSRCRFSTVRAHDVLVIGTLEEGDCEQGAPSRAAISRATTAAASSLDTVEIGLACGSALDGLGWLDPVTGVLVYRHAEATGGDTLRRFRKDALWWNAVASLQLYPADPSDNDDLALAPAACQWDRWTMQAGTGALMYACPVGGEPPQRDFYDAADAPRVRSVREVLSWNDGDYLLVLSGEGAVQVVEPVMGVATTVTGLPAGTPLAARATATGFRLALRDATSGADELWAIDELTAGAVRAGAYAAPLAGYTGYAWRVLDEEGSLYGGAFVGTREVLLRRPLAPSATGLVYAEAAMPAGSNDFSVNPFKPFVRLESFFLVTRP